MGHLRIGIVGTGAMGLALAEAFAREEYKLALCDRDLSAAQNAAKRLGATAFGSVEELAASCDVVVLCVKPGDMSVVCTELHGASVLLISVAAGVTLDSLSRWAQSARVVRAMPNTPARIGMGMTAITALDGVSAEDLATAAELLRCAGEVVQVDESQMHAVTALSGSGPAFAIAYAEAMIAAGVGLGLPAEVAETLVLKTMSGTLAWVASSRLAPLCELRQQVTSKGGTTAAGLHVMQQLGFDSLVSQTVQAASDRSVAMADAFR